MSLDEAEAEYMVYLARQGKPAVEIRRITGRRIDLIGRVVAERGIELKTTKKIRENKETKPNHVEPPLPIPQTKPTPYQAAIEALAAAGRYKIIMQGGYPVGLLDGLSSTPEKVIEAAKRL